MSTHFAKKLAGKVAVVTGASKGIGAAIARHLAAEGASVVINYSSSKAGADKVVANITSAGGEALAVQAEMARKSDIERLFAETKTAFGRLDILVNNAGIRVNAINPGMVETEGTHAAGIVDSDARKYVEAQTPLGRIGQPQDIAGATVFLASSDSSWITGQTFGLSGGFH